jgi:hypothetical protein
MSLLFYDRVNGTGAFYSVDANGNMSLLREDDGWRKTWWQIVPTGFYTPAQPGPNDQLHQSLLFYDDVAGEGELYTHDGAGNMSLLQSYSGWRNSWTQIIPGNWGGTRGLLFYDATVGEGAFNSIDAQGNMNLLKTNTGWRSSWTFIIPGAWNPPQTGLLFYDATAGEGAFYNVDSQGNISLIKQYEGWRHSWHYMTPVGLLGTSGNQTLLFYDGLAGVGEFYNVDGQGNISLIAQQTGWSHSWAMISSTSDVSKAVPGSQGQPLLSSNGLLFYDGLSGVGEFYVLDARGQLYLIQRHTGWRETWANILQSDARQFGKRPGG